MPGSKRVISLLGLGYWGKNLLRVFNELGALHTACDQSPDLLEQRTAEYPGINFSDDPDSVFSNPEIKAVAIATPAVTHFALAKKAILAGKDVFVEKPLALTGKEGAELVGLAESNGRILMVGHILQYHPAARKLREMVSSGQLGDIRYIYSNRLNIGRIRTEEDIWWSFAPHDISMVLALVGEEPIKVSSFGGDYLTHGIPDIKITHLEFSGGLKGHIFVSWLNPFKEQKLTVVGSRAMAVFDDVSREKLFLYPHKVEWQEGRAPVAKKSECEVVPFAAGEPLKTELAHFLECVAERKRPETDGSEGLRVLRILEAARYKANGEKWSAKPEGEKKFTVHPASFIDEGVRIGEGTKIWHFTHVLSGTKIGENCVIGQNVMIGPDVEIGNNCKVQNNVSLYKGVKLEDGVFCGPSCVFTNVYNPRAFIERKSEFLPTLVKKGATIGANATIVCGVTIGEYALVGAGAVVKRDVPPYGLVVGVPARRIGWVCKCGVPLKEAGPNVEARCPRCQSRYAIRGDDLTPLEENV